MNYCVGEVKHSYLSKVLTFCSNAIDFVLPFLNIISTVFLSHKNSDI